MDIERIAVNKVENEINKYHCLKGFLDKNDRTPMWDGEIFLYKENSEYNSNVDFLGKIGVQIKGKTVSKIQKGNSKYAVDIECLRAYKKDKKGVLLFVVEIVDNEEFQIYYANLLPVDLEEILENVKEGQITKTIDIRPIKEKSSSSMKMICQNFLKNSNEQLNIEVKSIDEIKNIEEIKFSVIGEKEYLEEYVLNNDVYTYAIDGETKKKIALPKFKDIFSYEEIDLNVKIKENEFYSSYIVMRNKDDKFLLFGKSIKIYLNQNRVDFKLCGNICERIIDLKFIKELLKENEIIIGNKKINLKLIVAEKDNYLEKIDRDIQKLNNIKEVLDKYKIELKQDLSLLTEKDKINLNRFMKINRGELVDGIELDTPYYIEIAGCNIVFIMTKKSGIITTYNFFSDLTDVMQTFYFDKNNEPKRISPYVTLTKDDLLMFSNVDREIIKESFELGDNTDETCERYNLFALELIKAYDESKNIKWLELAEFLMNKILFNNFHPFYEINKFQIIKRKREFTQNEIDALYTIKENEKDYMIQCAIAILLDNKSDYERFFNKLEDKEKFEKFPINNIKKV